MATTTVTLETIPAQVHFRHKKGDDWQPNTITVTSGGTPIDFTGATGTFTLTNPVKGDIALTLSGANVTLSSLGVVTLTMSDTQSDALRLGDFQAELKVTLSGGREWTITRGIFEHTNG